MNATTQGSGGAKRLLPEVAGSTLIGKSVARYRVQGLFGQGPLGDCYLAQDAESRQIVCAKVIPKHGFKQEADLLDFANRLELVSERLSHPTINRPVEYGPLGTGSCYIAAPYHHFVSLRRLLRRNQVLSERLALATVRLICKGLEHAHQMGVVHGNLKPSNLVFDKEGKPVTVDWSAPAVALLDAAGKLQIDPARQDIDRGLGYLAPELLFGMGKPVPGTDMFSVGALLYYMLTGKEPAAGSVDDVRQMWERGRYPKLEGLDVFFGDLTVKIVNKLTEYHAEKRYAGVGELWEDLNNALGIPTV